MLDSLVHELCGIQTAEDLSRWKQSHEISEALVYEVMTTVRRLLDRLQVETAGRLSNWCILLAEGFADPIIRARAAVTKGITMARTNDDAGALPYYDDAFHLYKEAGNELDAAKVRMNRVSAYCRLSRYEEALREGELSSEVFRRLGEKQLLARNYSNLGEVLFRLDRIQEFLIILERAEELLQEIGDRKSLALVYMNHAVACTSLNMTSEASRHYRLSKQFSEETGQSWLAACSNYNLGYLHYQQGEYTRALEILDETRAALPNDQWYVPLCDLTQSEIYLEMNMPHEAVRFAEAAHRGFESTEKRFEMAKATGVMAIAHSQLHEFKKAAGLFERAHAMFQEQGNHVRAAAMDLYRGVMYLQLGRYTEARDLAQQACAAFVKEDVKPKAAFAQVVSAKANLKLAHFESASQNAAAATSLHEESPTPLVAHQLHSVLGEIHLSQADLPGARDEFRRAIDELERVRANIALDELRLNYLKDKVPVYEMLVNADLKLGDPASLRDAFETGERSRSRTLVELLAGSVDSLRDVTSSTVKDVQEALGDGAALIEYFITGGDVMAFFLSKERFEVIQSICSRDELKQRFDFLQFHLSRVAANPEAARARADVALLNVQDHLEKLYRLLVHPIEPFLGDRKSLVFVPFDFLHYLPFHALFDGTVYLTDRFTISYAPAATIYRLFKPSPIDTDGDALLVGVPDSGVPFIEDEIAGIASVLANSRTLIGASATRSRVIREMTRAPIIHIASHASFRPDNPMFSSIELHDASLNFFDIYNLRTPAGLITLSGCGTGLSGVVAGDELLGLVRGFVYAGATSVVISLWDVYDRTTADLMKYFYTCLAEGQSRSRSLRGAMIRLRQDHPHPYYWAPFLLMGDPG